LPVTVLTVVDAAVMKIPSFKEDPVVDPFPANVIGAFIVVVIIPAVVRKIPWLFVVVPLPVPVRLIPVPDPVVICDPEAVIKIPLQVLVPVPPKHVPVMEPLVELIFPAAESSSP
jgi:hypothetical protein